MYHVYWRQNKEALSYTEIGIATVIMNYQNLYFHTYAEVYIMHIDYPPNPPPPPLLIFPPPPPPPGPDCWGGPGKDGGLVGRPPSQFVVFLIQKGEILRIFTRFLCNFVPLSFPFMLFFPHKSFHLFFSFFFLSHLALIPCPSTRLLPLQDTTAFFSSVSLTSKTKDGAVPHSSIEFVNEDIYLVDLF